MRQTMHVAPKVRGVCGHVNWSPTICVGHSGEERGWVRILEVMIFYFSTLVAISALAQGSGSGPLFLLHALVFIPIC